MPLNVHIVNLAEMGLVEIVIAKQIVHSLSRHLHDSLCLGIIQAGSRQCTLPHTNYSALAGQVFIINPGEVHACQSENGLPYDYSVLSIKKIAAIMNFLRHEELSDIPQFPQLAFYDDNLFAKIAAFIKLSTFSASLLELQATFLELFTHLVLSHGKQKTTLSKNIPSYQTAVTEVYQYIELHSADEISLEHLSSLFHISPYYLTRSFSKQFGIPPHVCQTLFRIKQAKQLLAKGTTLALTAVETGFNDQSHLSHRFKEIVGMTPGQWLTCRLKNNVPSV